MSFPVVPLALTLCDLERSNPRSACFSFFFFFFFRRFGFPDDNCRTPLPIAAKLSEVVGNVCPSLPIVFDGSATSKMAARRPYWKKKRVNDFYTKIRFRQFPEGFFFFPTKKIFFGLRNFSTNPPSPPPPLRFWFPDDKSSMP